MKHVNSLDYILRWVGRSGLPGARRIVNLFSTKAAEPRMFEIDFFGLRFVGSVTDAVDRSIFYFGSYSPGELDFIDHAVEAIAKQRQNLAFYDIGANSGQHSFFASLKTAVTIVHAFEPSLTIANRLESNILRNRSEKIVLHRVALGDEDGAGQLGSGFPGNSGSKSLNWTLPGAPTEAISIRAAGGYVDDQRLARIDFLKLDVEGHEKKVLSSLADRLILDRPVIMMELIGDATKGGFASPQELRAILYPRHRLFSLLEKGHRHELVEFDWNNECAVVIPEEIELK
jgi:FkbM family methyltransferase